MKSNSYIYTNARAWGILEINTKGLIAKSYLFQTTFRGETPIFRINLNPVYV